MTQCVWRQCTRHFGVICTQHQWLIQLSCLSTGFSPDVVREYLPHCSRSVLAKAQLFRWVHKITGRTWLVGIGDAIELQSLSPASLSQGYADVDVKDKAPMCLVDAISATSKENILHAMAICGFTGDTQHTGNAARPWEYNEGLRSIVALDSETIGYDVTQHILAQSNYFDKECFCKSFTIDLAAEPCAGLGLSVTRERLWMAATCGLDYLTSKWTNGLQTTQFDYIPTEDWHWPQCFDDMRKKTKELPDRCTTHACEIDKDGYCKIKSAVDRSCFCSNTDYSTGLGITGSCHRFETRIDYVNWLHVLCGNVEGWHGLPKNWRQLAGLTVEDMTPPAFECLRPRIRDYNNSTRTDWEIAKLCPSTEGKFMTIALINVATLIAVTLFLKKGIHWPGNVCSSSYYPNSWFTKGLAAAGLHVLAHWANAAIVESSTYYIYRLRFVFFWSTMPRLVWLPVLFAGTQPWKATGFSTIAASVFAEVILQTLAAMPMVTAIRYGWEHNFYSNGMKRLHVSSSAQLLYVGVLMWLFVVIVTVVLLLQTLLGQIVLTTRAPAKLPDGQANERTVLSPTEQLIAPLNAQWTSFETKIMAYWINRSWDLEKELLLQREQQACTTYGTLPIKSTSDRTVVRRVVRLYLVAVISMILLSFAQAVVWIGFLGLSGNEYVSSLYADKSFTDRA